MGSPIVSTDFVIANPSGDLCGEFQKMLSVADKLRVFFDWAFDEYGNATDEFKALFSSIGVPVGLVALYPTKIVPGGWLLCNGQAVSRTTYASLFTAIGTAYGIGDGSTTFNVPDYQGKFLLGYSSSHDVGTSGGSETHVLTEGEIPGHTHPADGGQNFVVHPRVLPNALVDQEQAGAEEAPGSMEFPTTGSTGGGQAHNNMPPYKTGLWLIKY